VRRGGVNMNVPEGGDKASRQLEDLKDANRPP
jgi:hypothetical protein